MTDWIKIVGSKASPYTQRRHLEWDRQYIRFPGKRRVSVREDDRLFLYTGHRLRRFFAICRVTGPAVEGEGDLRCPVLPLLVITDLEQNAVHAEEVFPLPGGTRGASLRQQSHVRIGPEGALRLIARLSTALYRELSAETDHMIQSSVFSPPSRRRR